MLAGNQIAVLTRALHFGSALALLFFLIASAPHRVHHFFERQARHEDSHVAHAATHDHGSEHQHDHEQKPAPASQASDCVVLSVAQQSHAAPIQPFEIALIGSVSQRRQEPQLAAASVFSLSPCSQRAPPLA
jgi:hypothetical protein